MKKNKKTITKETKVDKKDIVINEEDIKVDTQKKPSKIKSIINKPIVKGIGVCVLFGASMFGSYSVGKQVGLESPLTSKFYFSNQKIATVNGKEISFNNFKASMNILFNLNKDEKLTSEQISEYERQLIDYSVLNRAIYDVAVKDGVTSDPEVVQASYTATMEQLSSMLKLEIDEILKKFNLTESGIKESLREEYIASEYLENKSTVSDEEALKYYTEHADEFYKYRASHILIPTTDDSGNELSDKDKEKAKEKAEKLLKELKNGANFEELAKEHSKDGSAENGGDLDYFGKGEMVPSFESAVEKTEIGQLYPEVVETSYGYHIVKRTGEKTSTFDEEKESIIYQLSYNKKNEIIEKIQKEAKIDILFKGYEK